MTTIRKSDVQRLLDKATPLPWLATGDMIRRPDGRAILQALRYGNGYPTEDVALAAYAVNNLLHYEAAVDALARHVADWESGMSEDEFEALLDESRAILRRLPA